MAVAVRDRCLRVWAAGAVAMVHAWDPEVLVIGGGVMRNAGAVLPAIEAHVHRARVDALGRGRGTRRGAGRRGRAPRRGAASRGSLRDPDGEAGQLRQGPFHAGGAGRRLRGRLDLDHVERLEGLRSRRRCVVAVECYPGVHVDEVKKAFGEGLRPALVVDARQAFKDPAEVERLDTNKARLRFY